MNRSIVHFRHCLDLNIVAINLPTRVNLFTPIQKVKKYYISRKFNKLKSHVLLKWNIIMNKIQVMNILYEMDYCHIFQCIHPTKNQSMPISTNYNLNNWINWHVEVCAYAFSTTNCSLD
jgi:hypothetical protein